MKITREQILKMEARARRLADIENNLNFNRKRVHRSKKTYNRNVKHKGRNEEF